MSKKQQADSIAGTIATLRVLRDRLKSNIDLLDGGDDLSMFEKVQVGRCRDQLRQAHATTEHAIMVLKKGAHNVSPGF